MTSLEAHPGRTLVAPWLRGWIEEQEPEIMLLWRRMFPAWRNGRPWLQDDMLGRFVETAPPQPTELLQIQRSQALSILQKRARALQNKNGEAWPHGGRGRARMGARGRSAGSMGAH